MDVDRNNWITTGWSRDPAGRWIEVGHQRFVVCDATVPPDLRIEDIGPKLNELEQRLKKGE